MGAFRLGLEWIHSLNKCLLSTYCVPGHLIYMVSFQFILTPAYVEGTNDHSPLTDEKTTGRRSKDCSARDGESVPGRGENLHVGREAGKPGGEGCGWAVALGSAWGFYDGPGPSGLPSGPSLLPHPMLWPQYLSFISHAK